MAAAMALQLSTRRGTAWRLWWVSDFDSDGYQRFLSELRATVSGFLGVRER
jgi:hypothetical protein